MNNETCGTCKFLVAGSINAKTLERTLCCYRYPPTVQAIPSPTGIGHAIMRPTVKHNDPACGEYIPKVTN